MALPFLKKEKFGLREQETFVGKRCEIYLPRKFFNRKDLQAIASEIGNHVITIGIFFYNVDGQLYELQLPLQFEFVFSSMEKKRLRLKPDLPEEDYNVYILEYGDAFVYDILHKKDIDDFSIGFFNRIIENARIPTSIAYSDIISIFLSAMSASEISNLGISGVSIEFLFSEMFRNKKNIREPFRMAYNGKEYDYRMVSIKKLPELNNTLTSLIGEDIQGQLVASILRKRDGIEDRYNPLEEIVKY